MTHSEFKPSMSFAFSEGMKLAKKVRGPLIGFGFLCIFLITLPLTLLFSLISLPFVSVLSLIIEHKPIISLGLYVIIPLVILFYTFYVYYVLSLSSGVTRYLHDAYTKEEASFGTFFSGFSVGHKVLWSHIIRTFILLPLTILPLIFSWDYYLEAYEFMKNPSDLVLAYNLKESQPNVWIQMLVFIISIVPQILFFYVSELVIVSKLDAWKAIVSCFKVMKKHILFFVFLFFILAIINTLGAFALLFGLLYTIPLTVSILFVLFYQIFLNESSALSLEIDAFGSSKVDLDKPKNTLE